MNFLIALFILIASPCFAEDFIVSGNEVFKVVQTTKDQELVSLNEQKAVLERDIKNLEDNANDYQAKAYALKPELAEIDRRIAVLNEPEDVVVPVVDESIYGFDKAIYK